MSTGDRIVLSPFDEALARQKQPLLAMEEEKECAMETWTNRSNGFSSFIRPWNCSGRQAPPPSIWCTEYRNDWAPDGESAKFTHTIEFTESHSTITKELEYEDEEEGYDNTTAFNIDRQILSQTSHSEYQRSSVVIARVMVIGFAVVLMFRLMK